MITAHDVAPGNSGVIFLTDIFFLLFGLALLRLSRHTRVTELRELPSERTGKTSEGSRNDDGRGIA